MKSFVDQQSKPMTFPQYQVIEKESQIFEKSQEQKKQEPKQQKQIQKIVQGGLDGPSQSQTQSSLIDNMSPEVKEVNTMLFQPLSLTNEQLQDRNQAFEMFRKSYRKNQAMEENKEILKEKFQIGKDLGILVNQSRAKINQLKNQVYKFIAQLLQIEELRKEKVLLGLVSNQKQNGVDDAEEKIQYEIENQKQIYKQSFDELKELKSEIERIQHLLEKNREKMQKDFEKWLDVMLQQRQMSIAQTSMNSDFNKYGGVKIQFFLTLLQTNVSLKNSKVDDQEIEKKLQQFYKNKQLINKICQ